MIDYAKCIKEDLKAILRESDKEVEECRTSQGKLLDVIRAQQECIETILLILEEEESHNPTSVPILQVCQERCGDLRQSLRSNLNRVSYV